MKIFNILFIRELQNYLYSLRFRVAFVISFLVFIIGSVSFVMYTPERQFNHLKYEQAEEDRLTEDAERLTLVAVKDRSFVFSPRLNALISDSKEAYLPNKINYNAFWVKDFEYQHYNNNPLLDRTDSLSWAFIVTMFFSFITLLFAFDAVSGEKEDKTLSLVFSNAVPRLTFIASKLLSIIAVIGIMLLTGIVVSILILIFSGKIIINASFVSSAFLFLGFSLLFITVFAAVGVLSSVITKNSNVSLLISLCFWLFMTIVIPNASLFWAHKVFTIPTREEVIKKIELKKKDMYQNAPSGSLSLRGGDPFYPGHQLRAKLFTNILAMEKEINNDYYSQMFQQFENVRNISLISPIAQFEYINEAAVSGGYLRFRKDWSDLNFFQEQFLQWFKEMDAKDEESPHWYSPENYIVSTSGKPVDVDLIPRFKEQFPSFESRFQFISGYFLAMMLSIIVFLSFCFYFFSRYDVR